MNFDDLLDMRLPSQSDDPFDWMYESGEDDMGNEFPTDDQRNPVKEEGFLGEDDDDEDDDDDNDFDNSDSDDINDLDLNGLDDEDLDDIDLDDLEHCDSDDDNEEELDEDEKSDAQRIMNLAATPTLLSSELGTGDASYESFADEVEYAINEGLMTENSVADFYEIIESDDIFEERAFAAKTKVQFNEADRKKQLFTIGVFSAARAHNDRDYYKLEKLWAAERSIKKRLKAKYRSEALKLLKNYIIKLKKSKSGILSKMGKKLSK